ncbi:MAG: GAF domain-containing protein [Anaerolineae bacterium]
MGHTEDSFGSSSTRTAFELLQTLFDVGDMLKQAEAEGLAINAVLPRVLDIAVTLLKADHGSIVVVNEDQEVEYTWVAGGSGQENGVGPPVELVSWVVDNMKPSILHDTRAADQEFGLSDSWRTAEAYSMLSTPLIIRNRAVGAITVQKQGTHRFDEHDLNLLSAVSNQAATTIENARLYEEAQRQLQVSSLLHQASRVINSSLDVNEIMQLLLAQMNELLHAEAISIALVDKQREELVYQVAEGAGSNEIVGLALPINEGVSGWVVHHAQPALVNDARNDPRFHQIGDLRTGHATRAMVCAPIQFKGEVLGSIQAINPVQGEFASADLGLLVSLANIAGTALGNAQQYARAQAAEARYTRLFQDNIDPIFLTDLNGKIVDANRRALEFTGYNREDLLDLTIRDLHPMVTKLPRARRIKADEVKVFTSQIITQRQKLIHVEVYVNRIQSSGSEMLQWIHRDISEQIELEAMREEMIAMLYHDLQSPLGNVISSLELLRFDLPPDSPRPFHAMLDIAMRSSRRLERLIRSLLDIGQLEAGHPISTQEKVSMRLLVEDVHEIERPSLVKRSVQLVTEIAPDLPEVYVDQDMIRRVLVNLVDNALKYSHGSQKVTISAVVAPDDDKMVQVSVSDQGKGVPKRYRKSIFEKFARIKSVSSSKGLGLGLAFCRLAVEGHGGRIWVDDAPGGGARFSFTLPIVEKRSLTHSP